jgi:hypothetical protein
LKFYIRKSRVSSQPVSKVLSSELGVRRKKPVQN